MANPPRIPVLSSRYSLLGRRPAGARFPAVIPVERSRMAMVTLQIDAKDDEDILADERASGSYAVARRVDRFEANTRIMTVTLPFGGEVRVEFTLEGELIEGRSRDRGYDPNTLSLRFHAKLFEGDT